MLRLSTHDVPARDRLPFLHDFVARSVAGLQFTPRDEADFEFELATRSLDGGTVVGLARYSAVRGERTRALTADGRRNYMLTVHDTDYEVEAAGGRRLQVSRGDLVIVNESLCQSFTLPGTRLIAVVLDEQRMAEIAPAIRTQPIHHVPAAVSGAALVAGYARLLLADATLTGAAARLAGNHLYQLAALAIDGRKSHQPDLPGIGGARLALVKQDMTRNLTDPDLDIEAIARRQGVTPRYLQRLFEREGTSFGQFLRDARWTSPAPRWPPATPGPSRRSPSIAASATSRTSTRRSASGSAQPLATSGRRLCAEGSSSLRLPCSPLAASVRPAPRRPARLHRRSPPLQRRA